MNNIIKTRIFIITVFLISIIPSCGRLKIVESQSVSEVEKSKEAKILTAPLTLESL